MTVSDSAGNITYVEQVAPECDANTAESSYTTTDVAIQTVYLWHQKGTAPKRHRFGKHVRYTRADVEAWKAEHVVTADE